MTTDDDFYAMGGDSLIALRVVTQATALGIPVSLRDLLYYPTVRELAAAVADRNLSEGDTAEGSLLSPVDQAMMPSGVAAASPLSSLQLGLVYESEATGDPRLYHDMIGLEVRGPFDEPLFGRALLALCARHEALRTSFDLGGFTEPVQLVWPTVQLPLTVERTPDTQTRWRREHLNRRVDWRRVPLFECHVAVLPGSFHLTMAFHHAIIDGWSLSRLVVELLTLYDAALADRLVELPSPPVGGYRRFLAIERAAVTDETASDFWQAEADAPPLLIERDRFGATADPAQMVGFGIDADELDRLRGAAAKAEVPLKSLVLGCHVAALSRWTGRRRDVVTGLTVNGRPEIPGADLLVGLFLNTVPARFATADGDWAELGRAALAVEQRALLYRRYPLARIEQRLGRPAFDVSFNFTHFHAYAELDRLRDLQPVSWWSFDKASFPVMVDFMIDSRRAGTGVEIAFDPRLLSRARAEEFRDLLSEALSVAGAG